MIGYPFIQDLFTNILSKSKAIQGRFFVSSSGGREINSDELGQVLKDLFEGSQLTKKYPLDLMLPPTSLGFYRDRNGEWEKLRISKFFLTTSYYSGTNQVMTPNPATGTSTHTILYDWHDMKRCAVNFIYVLNRVQREQGLINNKFRLDQDRECVITPVSKVGIDRASGVRLDFGVSLFNGCVLEDYLESDISTITIPANDSHPEHQL